MKRCVVLIPAFNPPKEFVDYAKKIVAIKSFNLLVVNDGSKKDCDEIFDQIGKLHNTTIIKHEINQGKGRALKTGFEYFCKHYQKSDTVGIITADCDGQHLVEDVQKVAEQLANRRGDELVLGCRNFDLGNTPFKSKFGNKTTTFFFKLLYGESITDTQTGLRGLTYDYAKKCINLRGERFEYEIKMLINAVKTKTPIHEVKIDTVYLSDHSENFNPIKDSYKIYKVMFAEFFKFSFSGVTSAALDLILFTILFSLLKDNFNQDIVMLIATFGARIASSLYNYFMNRNIVFKSNSKNTFIKYYILCACQAFLSWFFVDQLFKLINIDTPTFIKICVDLVLFVLSYQIQQRFIFRKSSQQ